MPARGHDVLVDADTAADAGLTRLPTVARAAMGARVDVAVVVGGDGTMLSIARELAPQDVPLIGVNQGRLGFLTDVPLARIEDVLAAMLAGHYVEERRQLLEATIRRDGVVVQEALALNEVVVIARHAGRDDRERDRDRRPVRLRAARRRPDRRHADRIDRVLAVGAGADRRIRRCRRCCWSRWRRTR